DACGGLIDCTCADGEGCAEGLCVTPDCPDEATCGVVLTAGEALACRGDCEDGEPCELRDDGNDVCGDCSAECPENTACGLTELDCTVLSCPGSCAVDGQRCINRNTGDGPDNYACCMPRCPAGDQATCGAYVDTACGDAPLSCPGACPNAGEVCVMVSAGEYGCRIPECPPNATCGVNTADTGHQIQCEGSCTGANAVCQRDGNNYSCTCQPNENPCQDQCGVTVDNGCGTMVSCTSGAGQVCNDGRCCRPETPAAACAREDAECGRVVDPVCGTESDCGACRTDQTCDFDARVCECNPAQCAAHQSCGANEQCVCDNAKCPDGQACNASGVCACDSSQCLPGQACNASGMCACDSSQCPAGEACNASGMC